MEDDPNVSKMSIEDDENTNVEGSGTLLGDQTSQSGGGLKPNDGTLGNHGSQEALDIPPCGTNSSSASANVDMNITIDNFDGENGGNSELMSSSTVSDDFTLGNHGSQEALDIPPCGTNSSSASANVNMNVTGNRFGEQPWTVRINENSCCKDMEAFLKPNYKQRGGEQGTLGDAGLDGTGTTLAVHALLATCEKHGAIIKGKTSITDFGSGSGMFLIHALLFTEGKGIGIEMSQDRVNNSLSQLRALTNSVRSAPPPPPLLDVFLLLISFLCRSFRRVRGWTDTS
jgi:hypothetical protein